LDTTTQYGAQLREFLMGEEASEILASFLGCGPSTTYGGHEHQSQEIQDVNPLCSLVLSPVSACHLPYAPILVAPLSGSPRKRTEYLYVLCALHGVP
jgi:hypothetical protein